MARQEKNSNRRKGSQPKGFKKEGKAPRQKYTPESSSNEQESTDFVYGRHAVREALQQPERVNKLWVQEALSGKEITPIIDLARENRIQIQNVPKAKLQDLVGEVVHQGVVASIAAYEYATLEDVFEKAQEKNEDHLF